MSNPSYPRLEELIEHARRNEAIARKLFDIEIEVMNLQETGAYLERLTDMVRQRFTLDEVWLVLTDIESNQRLSEVVREQGALVTIVSMPTVDYMRQTQNARTPILLDQPSVLKRLVPEHLRKKLGSMAVLPLLMENRVIGAMVLGTRDKARYQPGMDSFFLHQLAIKASVGLDGVWAREQLRRLATRDPLTGLRNRREMEELLKQEMSRARRYGQPLSLVFIDCDDFKAVNDRWGHDCGDAYLCHLARHLGDLLRKDDTIFRFAGDEFIVLLPNQPQSRALSIAERMLDYFEETPFQYGDNPVFVRFSYGVASLEDNTLLEPERLLRQADQRLYEMKRERKLMGAAPLPSE
ncbi:sensor domain-containing diguanylate cyclase [Mangrovitalea sediminis]|uniref:sensor domain-containing diguanylate cyclase n=1 Tax=Mangrovitalea sediminis TaxID=1982043 RepID=UPI000BE5C9B3|nr:sensor domain-containing diguanylate cyclase [Mangrovitalea sediminis]